MNSGRPLQAQGCKGVGSSGWADGQESLLRGPQCSTKTITTLETLRKEDASDFFFMGRGLNFDTKKGLILIREERPSTFYLRVVKLHTRVTEFQSL